MKLRIVAPSECAMRCEVAFFAAVVLLVPRRKTARRDVDEREVKVLRVRLSGLGCR